MYLKLLGGGQSPKSGTCLFKLDWGHGTDVRPIYRLDSSVSEKFEIFVVFSVILLSLAEEIRKRTNEKACLQTNRLANNASNKPC